MQFFTQRFIRRLPGSNPRQRPAPGQGLHGDVLHGDCVRLMGSMAGATVDFILTDPPYLTNYRERGGRSVANDNADGWLAPAFAQMYRLLKPAGLCVSFYGWPKVDLFMAAWREAGFRPVGHIVFCKPYTSRAGFLQSRHECAYLLAKGDAPRPAAPPLDVLDWQYSGNPLHPTQKPVDALKPLIEAFTRPGDIVLDPFCGSGSTLVAAAETGRAWLGIELDETHHATAARRLRAHDRAA